MSKLKRIPKPFVKWAGGKEQLLTEISKNLPEDFSSYFEPFVGGGAVFFYLYRLGFCVPSVLSDFNPELIMAYQVIRDSVDELISELKSGKYKTDKDTFYQIRLWDRKPTWNKMNPIQRTARMLYLNKTCYNGLYRVNSKGQFNVPYGRYSNPRILDSKNLRAVSKALQNVVLKCIDFEKAIENAGENSFIYFDPPYDPLSETSNFTSYTSGGFDQKQQERLACVISNLTKNQCQVLVSNSDTPMIRELYPSPPFIIQEVQAKRAISCYPNGRGPITELLIRNYHDLRQETKLLK